MDSEQRVHCGRGGSSPQLPWRHGHPLPTPESAKHERFTQSFLACENVLCKLLEAVGAFQGGYFGMVIALEKILLLCPFRDRQQHVEGQADIRCMRVYRPNGLATYPLPLSRSLTFNNALN